MVSVHRDGFDGGFAFLRLAAPLRQRGGGDELLGAGLPALAAGLVRHERLDELVDVGVALADVGDDHALAAHLAAGHPAGVFVAGRESSLAVDTAEGNAHARLARVERGAAVPARAVAPSWPSHGASSIGRARSTTGPGVRSCIMEGAGRRPRK